MNLWLNVRLQNSHINILFSILLPKSTEKANIWTSILLLDMLRKIIAVLVTIITLWAVKETVVIFTTTDADIVAKRSQLILASLSITIPLVIISLLLWRPKPKADDHEPR
ncbi:hypothetical protein D3C87_226550 [compost metagenome]